MDTFLIYEFKVAVALAVFSLFYRLLLSKETFHRFNRVLLLATSLMAFILPFCIIILHKTVEVPAAANSGTEAGLPAMTPDMTAGIADYLTLGAGVIFIIGAAAVLARTAISILRIKKLVSGGRRIPQEDGTLVVLVEDKKYSPFSWMKYIVMSEEDYSSTGDGILIHEKAHIALGHSWDILFMELVTAVQWFNPAAWVLKADLTSVHEYEADEAVINAGTDMREYQFLLVRKAVSTVRYPAANNLNHSTLKNRITMMLCKRSSSLGVLKALYVIPLVCISLAVNAKTEYDYEVVNEPDEVPVVETAAVEVAAEPVADEPQKKEDPIPFQFLEKKPGFNGGDANEFSKWVNQRLVYPKEARDKNISGRVTMSFTIEKDGSLTEVKVLRGVHPLLDAEAVRVVSTSPKWTPGYQDGKPVRVTFTFPTIFMLNDSSTDEGEKAE